MARGEFEEEADKWWKDEGGKRESSTNITGFGLTLEVVKCIAKSQPVVLSFFFLHDIQYRSSDRRGHWISAVGVEVEGVSHDGRHLGRRHDGSQRKSVAYSFRHCHDVGDHVVT